MDAASAHDAFRARRYFGSLDGVRALSIVAVIWHHSDIPFADAHPAWRRGFLGVDMFFVLSGFLIVTLLLRERGRSGTISMRGFYLRRALRIFPLYYALLGLLSLVALARPGSGLAEVWWDELPILAFYLANWLPITTFMDIAWSLSAEEQFYLLWPPLERYASRFALPVLGVALVLSELVQLGVIDGFLLAAFGWDADTPEMLRGPTFAPILLGVLLAHGLHRPAGFRRLFALTGWRGAPLLFAFGIGLLIVLAPPDLRGWPRPTLHLLMTAFLASLVVREDHALARPLCIAPVRRIGVVSYGMYLLHVLAVDVARRVLGRVETPVPLDHFLLSLALTWGIAEVSFRYFERRFLRLKDRLSGRSLAEAAPGSA